VSAARYIGRFAPSPSGALHAGSLLAALASWLDARAHGGHWLVRIEDVDQARSVPGADVRILQQLSDCSLRPDETPVWQSRRSALYQRALDELLSRGLAYPCACSRQEIASASAAQVRTPHSERVYPGTCRGGLQGRAARAWRCNTARAGVLHWTDRRLGPQQQDVASAVGDFVLLRADGYFAYQLAVVVDDAAQGVTDVVRGADLADNTARQIWLQAALGLPALRYLHTPLVLDPQGSKLSKQNGAPALRTDTPERAQQALQHASSALGLDAAGTRDNIADQLNRWVLQWRARYALP